MEAKNSEINKEIPASFADRAPEKSNVSPPVLVADDCTRRETVSRRQAEAQLLLETTGVNC
jgi:hypothetical protein